MNNEASVSKLLCFLNVVLKSVGLAPFRYLKSKRRFVPCKFSTILSYVISVFIITISLPIELMAAMNFKPNRDNTVAFAIGYLHIFFTLVKIWFHQILTIANRTIIIRHFNQAFHINDALKSLCEGEHVLDDKMMDTIKLRILLFIFQSLAIIYGVNAYISRSFFRHNAALLTRIYISFTYINGIFVTTIYLGGSLMLCERYCRALCNRVQGLIKEVNEISEPNDHHCKTKISDKFNEILKAYNVVVLFIDNSHNLFSSYAVFCTCSTFTVSLHGVSFHV